ncbi:MAG: hypothetical protein Q4D95_01440 [Peptoniphilus sp.]|nr:hypothetical protein [Peptoniphilus sp.]
MFIKNHLKKAMLLFIMIALLSACSSKESLLDLKTDISRSEEVQEIVKTLDWKKYQIEKTEVEDGEIRIYFVGEEPDFADEDFNTLVSKGIILLILVENSESISYAYENPSFSIDVPMAQTILDANFQKSIEDYRSNKDDFEELLSRLSEMEISNDVFYDQNL